MNIAWNRIFDMNFLRCSPDGRSFWLSVKHRISSGLYFSCLVLFTYVAIDVISIGIAAMEITDPM